MKSIVLGEVELQPKPPRQQEVHRAGGVRKDCKRVSALSWSQVLIDRYINIDASAGLVGNYDAVIVFLKATGHCPNLSALAEVVSAIRAYV